MNRVHLDTHVAAGLAGRNNIAFSKAARHLIDSSALFLSPMVVLELELLVEIGRSRVPVDRSLHLLRQLGVSVLDEYSRKLRRWPGRFFGLVIRSTESSSEVLSLIVKLCYSVSTKRFASITPELCIER